jgi:hypothetical protein
MQTWLVFFSLVVPFCTPVFQALNIPLQVKLRSSLFAVSLRGKNLLFWTSNQESTENGPPTIGPGTSGTRVFWQLGQSSTLLEVSGANPICRIIFL